MRKIIIVFLLFVVNCAYSTSDIIVSKIYFEGLKRISLETALFYLPLNISNIIDNNNIADSIKTLFATEYFDEISISHNDKGVVVIVVKERPIINVITFQGNKTIKSDIVQQILDTKKIKPGQPLNNYSIFEIKNTLKDICYDAGKLNATVKIVPIFLPKNLVDLQVVFCEGQTTQVDQIDIFGNHIFSKKQLLKKFKLFTRSKWQNVLFHNRQYTKQKLLDDLETLQNFYLNQGYAKFRIDDVQINLSADKNKVHLLIYITEDTQYAFKSLVIKGDVLHHIPEIQEYLQIHPGELYNNNKIKEIEQNIEYILGKYGYLNPVILKEYDFDNYNKTIILYIYIDVNSRLYVREVRIIGNSITKDSVIRREIQQIEQTPLNYICVLKDQERLRRLNYFKTVNTYIEYLPDLLNKVDIVYKIEEHNTGHLNCSIGFGTESGLNMQIGIYQENLMGSGDSISITANRNHYQTYFDVLMLKKYLGINKMSVSGKIFYDNHFANKTDTANYNTKNYGVNITYAYPFSEYKIYDIGLNYVSNYLSHIIPQITVWRYLNSMGINPETMIKNSCLNDNIDYYSNDFLVVSGWTFNNLNSTHFPKFGSRINIIGKLTLPGSNNKYYKILFDSSHYLPLDKSLNWILMSNLFIGHAGSVCKKENPFYDNFYIGGIETIRGFKLNSIGPKAVYYYCNQSNIHYSECLIKNSQNAIGGNAVTSIKHELIVPISCFNDIRYSDVIRISLFIDAGTIWDTYWKNTAITRAANIVDYSIFGHIRISSGVSLKWISPIGPVMFSYSKVIKKYFGDLEEPFQFSIGKSW